jgi:hypothetical protein
MNRTYRENAGALPAAVSLDRTSMRPNPTSHKSRLTTY